MSFQHFLEHTVFEEIRKQNSLVINSSRQQNQNLVFIGKREYRLYLRKYSIDFLLEYFFAKHLNQLVEAYGMEVISNQLIFLPVLKGGVYLESAIKEFSRLHFIPNEFVGIQSYENNTRKICKFYLDCPQEKIENKHLILMDEVIDSGETLKQVIQKFSKKKPLSINLFVSINKLSKQKHKELIAFFKAYGVYTTAICCPHNLWAVGTLLGLDSNQMCRATLDDLYVAKSTKNWNLEDEFSQNPYNKLGEKINSYKKGEISKEQISEFIEAIHQDWYS